MTSLHKKKNCAYFISSKGVMKRKGYDVTLPQKLCSKLIIPRTERKVWTQKYTVFVLTSAKEK